MAAKKNLLSVCHHYSTDKSPIKTKIPPPDRKGWSARIHLGMPILPILKLEYFMSSFSE